MNDRELKSQTKRIKALIKKWNGPLGLHRWWITYVYHRGVIEVTGESHDGALAVTKASWKYETASIHWNMPEVAGTKDADLEYAFVHECCHVLVAEMRPMRDDGPATAMANAYDIDHEEHVVTRLAWAFIWAREEGEKHKPVRSERPSA